MKSFKNFYESFLNENYPDEPPVIVLKGRRDGSPASNAKLKFTEGLERNPLDGKQFIKDGVLVELEALNYDVVLLKYIRSLDQKEGSGTRVLNELKELADHFSVKIKLFPKPLGGDDGINEEQLISWYSKHGFVPARNGYMVYNPK